MAHPSRKFFAGNKYQGTVGNKSLIVFGRTKREAVKRMRKAFLELGMPTMPTPLEDKLEVLYIG